MAEDAVAHSEIAALTRRFDQAKEKADRGLGIMRSDFTAVRLQVGNLDQKSDQLAGGVRMLSEKIDPDQAQAIELLSSLVGKDPGTAQPGP
ncbi:hypothetical protein GCM10027168_69310 [Streptomyces capparidis]